MAKAAQKQTGPYDGPYMVGAFVDVDFKGVIGAPNAEEAVQCVVEELGNSPANHIKVKRVGESAKAHAGVWVSPHRVVEA